MIKWANEMYYDWCMVKLNKSTKKAINAGKLLPSVYCIALSTNPENLFDIIHANELKFPYYVRRDIYVIGLASGRESAISLVAKMIDEVYQNTGDVKVREYYQERWEAC